MYELLKTRPFERKGFSPIPSKILGGTLHPPIFDGPVTGKQRKQKEEIKREI